ncbi:MAG: hypothetical protein P8Z30_00695 [Acidobacteriota bacterium]
MRWTRSWILCAAFYYPALWLAVSCVFAFPGLFRSALSGEHIVLLRLTPFGMMVRSTPSDPAIHPNAVHSFFASSSTLWLLIPLAVAIAATLGRAERTRRTLSGLFIAVLADVALVLPFARFRGPRIDLPLILATIFSFAMLCFGLRLMLSGWAGSGYWGRLAGLCAGLALLPLPLWLFFRFLRVFQFRDFLPMLLPAAVAGAVLVSFWKPKLSGTEPNPATARPILSGFAVTILLVASVAFGGPWVSHAFQERQQRANQAAVASLPPIPMDAPYPRVFFQKGVSFSAEFPNPYASAGARQMLRSLRADGVNAVSLVPYGWMSLGSPEVHGFGKHSWESEEGLRELSRLAHAIGMKVMLKPGMWIRGGHFGGDIQFSSQPEREQWFQDYGKFIDRYAKIATEIHADVFCIGGEFVRLSPHTAEWLKIIKSVRKIYPGPLTYAANFGDEFQNLKFWSALDYIGLQEYYPLPDDLSTTTLVEKVEAVQKQYHKPVIFTEVGFPSVPDANQHPWEDGEPGKVALQLQARCYQAIFRAFYNKPWFEGMYWWKVGSNGFGGPEDTSLTPWGKPAMEVVRKWYKGGERRNARLGEPMSK